MIDTTNMIWTPFQGPAVNIPNYIGMSQPDLLSKTEELVVALQGQGQFPMVLMMLALVAAFVNLSNDTNPGG